MRASALEPEVRMQMRLSCSLERMSEVVEARLLPVAVHSPLSGVGRRGRRAGAGNDVPARNESGAEVSQGQVEHFSASNT